MKILVVCQYYHPEPFRISDICEALAARGHEVTVVTGTPNYPEGEIYPGYEGKAHTDETIGGVKVHRCPLIPRKTGAVHRLANYFSFPASANRYLRSLKEDFDVVFVNQLSPVMMADPGIRFAKRHSIRCVTYCLDLWPLSLQTGGIGEHSPIYRVFTAISKNIYHRIDTLAVSSYGFLPYFRDAIGLDPEKITYIPQYAEALFDAVAAALAQKDGVDFVFAGNIGAAQAVETMVEAAKQLRSRPDIRLHIVGGGKSLTACRSLAEGLENITFYGRLDLSEMPRFYALADAMLIGLLADEKLGYTLPGKVQSYMAAGKPIFGAVEGETARVIADADCGKTCPAEDASKLAALLSWAADHKADLPRMGEQARQYYGDHFSKERMISALEALLEENCV